jgi:hypothetical protein
VLRSFLCCAYLQAAARGLVARSRVTLTPIAAPSIMGLFGIAIATVMPGAHRAAGTAAP